MLSGDTNNRTRCPHKKLVTRFHQEREMGAGKRRERNFPGGSVVKTPASNARGAGSIPGWAAKIPHALGPKNQHIKQKKYCNKFKKDLKKKKRKPNLRLLLFYVLVFWP